jgi:hypothetical protein
MAKGRLKILFFSSFLLMQAISAQELLPIEFGKITPADFAVSAPKYDPDAGAVIIADVGKTKYEGNNKGWFIIIYTRFIRVKIINKLGMKAAENLIYFWDFKDGNAEKITELKGITYNLVSGSIQQTRLDEEAVSIENKSKYHQAKKFKMPALKPGSVYDITYTVKSNLLADPPAWNFQGAYPCRWSEYESTIPAMYHYIIKTRGDDHYDIKTQKTLSQIYAIGGSGGATGSDFMVNVSCPVLQNRWVKKNIPVLKIQPFLSSAVNYESGIYFVLEYFKLDDTHYNDLEMKTWNQESRSLLQMKDFGFELNQDNGWMDEELKSVADGSLNNEEEIRRIFYLVRDHFVCADNRAFYVNVSLKDVYKKRSGNAAELNLLLVAMLRHRSIPADPVILSTRENGVVIPEFTQINNYNYVICAAKAGGKTILLDASQPFNPFGKLPPYCYNWTARLIHEVHPDLLLLSPDSVYEAKTTNVIFVNEESGKATGTLHTVFGNHESYHIREEIKKASDKAYMEKTTASFTDFMISHVQLDSLQQTGFPVAIQYDIDFKNLNAPDMLNFNPVLDAGFKTNPFTDTGRLYPVEMPFKIDYIYLLSMEIPRGFRVDQLPKSVKVKFNESEGIFEYLIQQNTDNIQMRIHLKFNKSTFPTEEYGNLRDFFDFVVKKENEQIIFKKNR